MIVAQISDPHVSMPGTLLYGGYDPAAALTAVLDRIARLRPAPDFVIFSGDLTENGLPDEYAHFLRLVEGLTIPSAAIPGNHDRRDAFHTTLTGSSVIIGTDPSWLHLTIERFAMRLIGLDTLALEGDPGGELGPGRLGWIERRLGEAPEQPTLIFMHHPPFATGIGFMDIWGLANPERLEAIVARHPQVLRVSCGHVHRCVETAWAGTIAGICPSVAWQVPLLDPDAPPALTRQVPGFQLHFWTEELGVVTHTEFLTDCSR